MNKEKIWKRTLLSALVIVLSAQLNLSPISSDFRISIAAIVLALFIWLSDMLPVKRLAFIVAAGIFLTRVIRDLILGGSISDVVNTAYPEAVFYLIYGLGLAFFRYLYEQPYNMFMYMAYIAFFDYASNLIELYIRMGTKEFQLDIQFSLIFVATVRVLIVGLIISFLGRYRLVLMKRSTADRYQRLLLLISHLHSEMLWMEKSTILIEETMNRSYKLYHTLQDSQCDAAAAQALTVAKDIHEVKKEYKLIMRGLSEAMAHEKTQGGMSITELLTILGKSVEEEYARENLKLKLSIKCSDRLSVSDPYPLLSLFHNLLTNAAEASKDGEVRVVIEEYSDEKFYIFEVKDNGRGITDEYIDKIFDSGFSTKINYETGFVSRGLGLPIVMDITENILGGNISVDSDENGTLFKLKIPSDKLEVMQQ